MGSLWEFSGISMGNHPQNWRFPAISGPKFSMAIYVSQNEDSQWLGPRVPNG